MTNSPKMIKLGDYFLERLVQLGIKKMYGVPGDFNLAFLDLVEDHASIDYVGCCNELNASYAADGYARVAEAGIGCLVTTFGVGELSAVNGIAGAHSERVPIVHLVGVPSTKLQAHHAVLHHTLGDGRFDAFTKIAQNVTCAQALLTSASSAASEIDRVLRLAVRLNKPVYITLPTDLVEAQVLSEPLKIDIRISEVQRVAELEESEVVTEVVYKISELYQQARNPIVLVDACTIRFRVESLALGLIEGSGMPFFTTPMGKTAISESHRQFGGLYVGDITVPSVKKAIESSDLVFAIGPIMSDFNTGSFSYHLAPQRCRVELHSDSTTVGYAQYPSLGFRQVLPALTSALSALPHHSPVRPQGHSIPDPRLAVETPGGAKSDGNHVVSQDEFWPLWGRFLKEGDIVLGETGTSSFGLLDVKFPEKARMLSQVLWGSIGWTGGATLGAAQAAQELGRRTVLFIGDGSLQLTVQELSTMMRVGVKPIVVVLDNDGYSIERFIHGMERKYNDIAPWKWTSLLETLSIGQYNVSSRSVNTRAELEALLAEPGFAKAEKMQLVAVKLPKEDAPRALKMQMLLTAEANAG